jgi:hypothetical protein
VQNIEIYLTTKISCQARHIRLLDRISEALARDVRPSSLFWVNQAYLTPYLGSRDLTRTCPAAQPYPALYPDSRDLTRTCLTPIQDMSDISALSRVTPALSGLLARFRRWWPDMSGS